jgi:hypothetical protein
LIFGQVILWTPISRMGELCLRRARSVPIESNS